MKIYIKISLFLLNYKTDYNTGFFSHPFPIFVKYYFQLFMSVPRGTIDNKKWMIGK